MKSVLSISDSVVNTEYDFQRSVRTIKAFNMDPTSVVPVFYDTDGNVNSMDITDSLEFAFTGCNVSGISIGYLTSKEAVDSIAEALDKYEHPPVVYNPIIISDSGDIMISEETYFAIVEKILPKIDLLIINRFEAETLVNFECKMQGDYLRACKKLFNMYGCQVLIRGTYHTDESDVYFDGKKVNWFETMTFHNEFVYTNFSFPVIVACNYAETGDFNVARARDIFGGKITIVGKEGLIEFGGITLPETKKVEEEVKPEVVDVKPEVVEVKPEVVEEVKPSIKVEAIKPETKVNTQEAIGILSERLKGLSVNTSKPTTISTSTSSLVSPAKSLRDLARSFEQEYAAPQNKSEAPAVTSSIVQKKSPLDDIKAMRERLQKLTEGSKVEEKKSEDKAN